MLPHEHRLSDRREIQRTLRFGKKAYGSLFSITFLPNSLDVSRFSIVVGKKTLPKAVDRNRLKRLVREVLRRELYRVRPGFDGVFVALRQSVGGVGISEVSADIHLILRRSHIAS